MVADGARKALSKDRNANGRSDQTAIALSQSALFRQRTSMFLNSADFPFTAALESNWQIVRNEFEQLTAQQLSPWPERNLYNQGWDVFGLWGAAVRFDEHCRLCPRTASLVESIPGMTTAGFSRLAPGAKIRPHTGYTNTVLRCHLGLIVPAGCGIRVGETTRNWEEGKSLVFDDTQLHSAWNDSTSARIILIIDFVRPGKTFDPTVSIEAQVAIRAMLEGGEQA